MTTLIFVRHGQTDWNRALRIQGNTDIPLNDTGRMQAREAAQDLTGADASLIVSSPLLRARETAQIIAAELGLEDPQLFADLRERNYGEAEGMLVADFRERYVGGATATGAETDEQLLQRGLRAVHEIDRAVRDALAADDASVIVVSHGGLIGTLIRYASGGTLPLPGERIANGSQHVFRVDQEALQLVSYSAVAA